MELHYALWSNTFINRRMLCAILYVLDRRKEKKKKKKDKKKNSA